MRMDPGGWIDQGIGNWELGFGFGCFMGYQSRLRGRFWTEVVFGSDWIGSNGGSSVGGMINAMYLKEV